jgi:hypothetical protein
MLFKSSRIETSPDPTKHAMHWVLKQVKLPEVFARDSYLNYIGSVLTEVQYCSVKSDVRLQPALQLQPSNLSKDSHSVTLLL